MADTTKGGGPTPRPGNPYREPPTIDLTPTEIVEESAPIATHGAPDQAKAAPAGTQPVPAQGKPGEAKPADAKATDTKPADAKQPATPPKSTDAKAGGAGADPKAAASVPASKPTDAKTADTKAADAKAAAAGTTVGAPPRSTEAPERRPSHLGVIGLALAAIAGGLAGVAGALAVVFALSSPQDVAARLAALDDKVNQRLAATAAKSDVDQLRQQVTGLGGTLADLNGTVSGLGKDVKAAQERVQAPGHAPADGGAPAASTAEPGAAPAPAADPQVIAELRERLDALDKRLAAAAPGPAPAPALDPAALADLRGRLDALDQRTATVPSLGAEVQQLQSTVTALNAGAGKTASEAMAQVDALGRRIASVESRPADPRLPALARATVARDLIGAIERGRPYAAELAALGPAGPADPSVNMAALQAAAATGVATTAELKRSFDALSDKLAAAAARGDGLMERLATSASRIIRIQPVDSQGHPAEAPAGSVTRVEAALTRGDTAAALAAWQALPEPARQLSAAFGERLAARVGAEQAARALLASSIAALAGTPGAKPGATTEGRSQ